MQIVVVQREQSNRFVTVVKTGIQQCGGTLSIAKLTLKIKILIRHKCTCTIFESSTVIVKFNRAFSTCKCILCPYGQTYLFTRIMPERFHSSVSDFGMAVVRFRMFYYVFSRRGVTSVSDRVQQNGFHGQEMFDFCVLDFILYAQRGGCLHFMIYIQS